MTTLARANGTSRRYRSSEEQLQNRKIVIVCLPQNPLRLTLLSLLFTEVGRTGAGAAQGLKLFGASLKVITCGVYLL